MVEIKFDGHEIEWNAEKKQVDSRPLTKRPFDSASPRTLVFTCTAMFASNAKTTAKTLDIRTRMWTAFYSRTNCSLLIIFHDTFDGHSINNGHNYRLLLYFTLFTFIAQTYRCLGNHEWENPRLSPRLFHVDVALVYCPIMPMMHHRIGHLLSCGIWTDANGRMGNSRISFNATSDNHLISSVNRMGIDKTHTHTQ